MININYITHLILFVFLLWNKMVRIINVTIAVKIIFDLKSLVNLSNDPDGCIIVTNISLVIEIKYEVLDKFVETVNI